MAWRGSYVPEFISNISSSMVSLPIPGYANLTGAGLGIKSPDNRNFEAGFITTDPAVVEAIMNQFDEVWLGKYCKGCGRKGF